MNGDKLLKIARENPDVTIEDGTIKFVAEIANIDKAAAMLSSQADVTIDDGTQPAPRSKKKPNGRKRSSLERQFAGTWAALDGPALEGEYRFHPKRRWLLDFAHPATKTAIELEGGAWSNGRHTRGKGFIADCEKYNAAGLLDWTVFRLATGMITVANVQDIIGHIRRKQAAK